MKYTRKPVEVSAAQWHRYGDLPEVDHYRHPKGNGRRYCVLCKGQMQFHGWVQGLEFGHRVCPTDWIITDARGDKYPCKNDVFFETYEPAIISNHGSS